MKILRNFSEIHCKLSSLDQGLRLLTLCREKPKNALGKVLLEQLADNLARIGADTDARVAILHSSIPGVFCSGADLKERAEMTGAEVESFLRHLRATFLELEQLRVPTIACIEGAALGGGLEIALACDLRVSSTGNAIGLVETALGIIPGAGGTQRLPKLVGTMRAKEMIFTAKRYLASELKDYGLFNYVGEAAYDKALELATQISQNAPIAIKMAKRAVDVGAASTDGMRVEELCYAQVIPTQDRLEALSAFREKRKPFFKGI